ncbi:MAG TPA: GGDEF domain-containing protein [Terracidiphilus sp.]
MAHTEYSESIVTTTESVRRHLQQWARCTGRHYQHKADEVKEILLAMARAAESMGESDQRCAEQISEVTSQLKKIANLDDLTEVRASIEKSAAALKNSIDRMTAEGKAVLEKLRIEASSYQSKLEEAEQLASRDALTRLGNRLWVEGQIQNRIEGKHPFCAAILDIDDFKYVNDKYGHVVGDELLKQFATELRSACRSTDVIGRWGGDEFIVLLDCGLTEAEAQVDRVSEWVCGNYTVSGNAGPTRIDVRASIGVAEHSGTEAMEQVLDRADAQMYQNKPESRRRRRETGR